MPTRALGDAVLAVFKQACASERIDVADYLLRALEALEGEPRQYAALAEAYLAISRSKSTRIDDLS